MSEDDRAALAEHDEREEAKLEAIPPEDRELPPEDDEPEDAAPPPRKLEELLAEGVTIEDAYAALIGRGEEQDPVSLSELKDRYQDLAELETAQQALEVDRDTLRDQRESDERERVQRETEMGLALRLVDVSRLTTADLDQVQEIHERYIRSEAETLLRIVPELKDPEAMAEFQREADEVMAEYGFSKPQRQNVHCSRTRKMLRDFIETRKRLARARSALETAQARLAKPRPAPKAQAGSRVANGAAGRPRPASVAQQAHELIKRATNADGV